MLRRLLLVVVAAAVLAAGAAQAAPRATVLKIKADPSGALKYNVTKLTAKAGTVTIVMANPSLIPHNVAIKGKGVNVKGKIVPKGGVSKATAKLKRGKYTFYCTVPGHEAAGMKGTLTVK